MYLKVCVTGLWDGRDSVTSPQYSEEHIGFLTAASRSRRPRELGLAVLEASRRTLRHRSASRRGRHELASLLWSDRSVPKHTALVPKQASERATAHCPSASRCQRSEERLDEHSGRCSELPRVRWAAAGRPVRLRRALWASQPSASEPSRAPWRTVGASPRSEEQGIAPSIHH
jgi:hypothetical protein